MLHCRQHVAQAHDVPTPLASKARRAPEDRDRFQQTNPPARRLEREDFRGIFRVQGVEWVCYLREVRCDFFKSLLASHSRGILVVAS